MHSLSEAIAASKLLAWIKNRQKQITFTPFLTAEIALVVLRLMHGTEYILRAQV